MARSREPNIESIFVGLRRAWHPPSAAIEASFTRLTRTLAGIYATLGSDPDLGPLHAEIYRDFPGLAGAPAPEPADRRKLADRRAAGADTTVKSFYLANSPIPRRKLGGRRTAAADTTVKSFYLCNSLIQLMEDVYLDLHLEQEYRHPDNRGWMNLFRHWASADTFRQAWAVSAPTFGSRFQEFCRRRLNLTLGVTDLVSLWDARYSEKAPLDHEKAGMLEEAEGRIIQLLTSHYVRGDPNPIARRVRQVVLCLLRVPLGTEAALAGLGRGVVPIEERLEDKSLKVPYGIAFIAGDTQFAPEIDREESDDRDDSGRLITLRVRRHLRDQGLGRQLMLDLVERMGVVRTASPTPTEMRALGLAADAGEQIDSMFKSVVNEVALSDQRRHPLASNAVFGPLPRLPYSGVVRPKEATWAHAVAFIYWILAWTDRDSRLAEKQAVAFGVREWAGKHVELDEVAFAVREAQGWYLTAKRPVTALWPEVRAIVRELKKQPWFGDDRRAAFRAGLEQVAWADTKRSPEEERLMGAIREWLVAEEEPREEEGEGISGGKSASEERVDE